MNYARTHWTCLISALCLLSLASLAAPRSVLAECKEFKIVEYEDRVEAVCVGEPLTEAQKKANQEEEKRYEAEARRQRAEEHKREREAAAANKAQAETAAADERKKRILQPGTPPQTPPNRNITTNPQILYK